MTEEQRDKILLSLVDKLNENIEFTKSIDKKLNENIEFTKSIDKKLNENIEFTKGIDIRLKDTIKFAKAINNSVVVIEVEHGNKLSALFDGYTSNSEKLNQIQKDIKKMNTLLQKHDDQLYLLKSN